MGINVHPIDPKILTGNSVTVYIGGLLVAIAQNFRYDTPLGAEQFHGLGTEAPLDIIQLVSNPTITVDYFRLTNPALLTYQGGKDIIGFLTGQKFDITVLSGGLLGASTAANSGGPLATFLYCVPDTSSVNMVANQGVIQTVSFKAASVIGADGIFLTPPSPTLI